MATQEEHKEVMAMATPYFQLLQSLTTGDYESIGDEEKSIVNEVQGFCAGVNDTLFCIGKRLDISSRQKVWEVHKSWAEGYDDGVRAASSILAKMRASANKKRAARSSAFNPNGSLPIIARRG
jgi:hypothetical protein